MNSAEMTQTDPIDNHHYVYIFVRTDIPVSHQMAQACHGALEAGIKFPHSRGSTDSIIVLKVKDKIELLKAHNEIQTKGIHSELFWEPDWDYGHTAFGTRPVTKEERKFFKGWSLWKA